LLLVLTQGKPLSAEVLSKAQQGCGMQGRTLLVYTCSFACRLVLTVFSPAAVAGAVTQGKPLSPEVLLKAQQGCEMALQLDEDKQQVRPIECAISGTVTWFRLLLLLHGSAMNTA
jgi:hypothetical protein